LHIYSMPLPSFPAAPLAPPSDSARRATAGLVAIALAGAWAMSPTDALWMLLIAPVLEEIVFRAGLQEELLRRAELRGETGALSANVLTALIFGAAHLALRPGLLAALTVLPALLVGLVYQRWRRVAPCVALHSLFNAVWLFWAGLAI
jgi:Type II CAAX prenyl endopeptidase Rce1-like